MDDCTCPYGFRSLGKGNRVEARIGTDPRCPEHGKRAHLSLVPLTKQHEEALPKEGLTDVRQDHRE